MGKGKKGKRKKWPIVVIVILVVLIGGCSGVYFFAQSELNKISRKEAKETIKPEDEYFETNEEEGDDPHATMNPEDLKWPEGGDIMKDKDIMNIMLIGQDKRPGEDRARSDSMMILTVNKRNQKVKITSLMRDMYLQIPGYSDNRINAAYAFGGMKLLDATVEKNFLVKIDGNVEVDFDGFQKVIDKIGGVDIDINAKEAAHLKEQGFSGLSEGKVHMDGKLALAYSRIRKVGNNDFERTHRQRNVMLSAFQKVKTLGLPELTNMVNALFPYITTDLTNNEMISLVYNVFRFHPEKIEENRIPLDGTYESAWIRKMLVMVPDLPKNREALQAIIFEDSSKAK